nr:hypothetical protein [Halorussus sp. MSC15.2]
MRADEEPPVRREEVVAPFESPVEGPLDAPVGRVERPDATAVVVVVRREDRAATDRDGHRVSAVSPALVPRRGVEGDHFLVAADEYRLVGDCQRPDFGADGCGPRGGRRFGRGRRVRGVGRVLRTEPPGRPRPGVRVPRVRQPPPRQCAPGGGPRESGTDPQTDSLQVVAPAEFVHHSPRGVGY